MQSSANGVVEIHIWSLHRKLTFNWIKRVNQGTISHLRFLTHEMKITPVEENENQHQWVSETGQWMQRSFQFRQLFRASFQQDMSETQQHREECCHLYPQIWVSVDSWNVLITRQSREIFWTLKLICEVSCLEGNFLKWINSRQLHRSTQKHKIIFPNSKLNAMFIF